jgi:hypothetical protein
MTLNGSKQWCGPWCETFVVIALCGDGEESDLSPMKTAQHTTQTKTMSDNDATSYHHQHGKTKQKHQQ